MMHPTITQKLPELLRLCQEYHVVRMYLFGSATTAAFNEKSDLDFLLSFSPDVSLEEYADNYFELMFALEALFGRKIDLVTEKSLSNPYFIQSVNESKLLIYGAA